MVILVGLLAHRFARLASMGNEICARLIQEGNCSRTWEFNSAVQMPLLSLKNGSKAANARNYAAIFDSQ
jgi:hypothetical protein